MATFDTFYVLSKPLFINSDLNSFIKFDIDYIESIYQDFSELFMNEENKGQNY